MGAARLQELVTVEHVMTSRAPDRSFPPTMWILSCITTAIAAVRGSCSGASADQLDVAGSKRYVPDVGGAAVRVAELVPAIDKCSG